MTIIMYSIDIILVYLILLLTIPMTTRRAKASDLVSASPIFRPCVFHKEILSLDMLSYRCMLVSGLLTSVHKSPMSVTHASMAAPAVRKNGEKSRREIKCR